MHTLTYEVRLDEPERFQAVVHYRNQQGKSDSVIVTKPWRYSYKFNLVAEVAITSQVKPINPKNPRKGEAYVTITVDSSNVYSGVGNSIEKSFMFGPTDPNLIKTH